VTRFSGPASFRTRIFWSIIPVVLTLLVLQAVVDITGQKRLMTAEFTKRGEALVASLAEAGELGVLTENPLYLDAAVRGAVTNPDVAYVAVYGERQNVLAHWGKGKSGPESWDFPPTLGPALFRDQKATSRHLDQQPERLIEFLAPVLTVETKSPDEVLIGIAKSGSSTPPRRRAIGVVRLGMSLSQLDAHLWAVMELWVGVALAFVVISMGAVYYSSRRITRPIRELTESADRLGQGNLEQSIPVTTQDEVGQLAATFNKMARSLKGNIDEKERILAELRNLNQTLEERISRRTAELQERTEALERSLEEVRAMGDVSRAVSSSLDLRQVLDTAATYALRLANADAGGIFEVDIEHNAIVVVAARNLSKRFIDSLQDPAFSLEDRIVARATDRPVPRQIPDVEKHRDFAFRGPILREGFHALLTVPMDSGGRTRGLVLYRRQPGTFDGRVVNLLTTLANQSKVAIENARLFKEVQNQRVELEAKRRELEVAGRHKSEFLATMSHELRTPLNAIIGYSEMLQEEMADQGEPRYGADIEKIKLAGRHLLELINAVLDLSKIEAGKMELYLEEFDVATLVKDIGTVIRPLAEKNANRLEVVYAEPGSMRADRTKLRQALFNLLSNACKFTERGTVILRVTRQAGEPSDWLTFSVEDTGIGMTAEQLARLFKEFSQADAATAQKYGGTGLGLVLSRRIVRLMGGDIAVASEPGRGSTFTARVPAEVVDLRSEPTPSRMMLVEGQLTHAMTVLVIDDESSVRELMQRFLVKEGFRVITAASGEEGIRLARETRPDAITLDVMMPGMDGWTVLTALKADPDVADIPVIMLTIVDDKNMGYALGATDYITKPVERNRLVTVLRKHRRGTLPVLLVEDDAALRELVRRTLEKEGCVVTEAENGRVALDRVREALPGLILLDLLMPEMDGFEFLSELRRHDAWRGIPVILVTAKTLTAEDRQRMSGQVQQFLEKGAYSRDALLREVRDMVRARAARPGA
jgi:signal transduction histidine kinase/CheY-like chemotaxis protein